MSGRDYALRGAAENINSDKPQLRAHGLKANATSCLPQLRSHGLLPVDHYACCALRIDRRLGTFAAQLRDRPASGICAYGPVKGASKDAPRKTC